MVEIVQCSAVVVLGALVALGGAASGAAHSFLAGGAIISLGTTLLVATVRRYRRMPRALLVVRHADARSRRSS